MFTAMNKFSEILYCVDGWQRNWFKPVYTTLYHMTIDKLSAPHCYALLVKFRLCLFVDLFGICLCTLVLLYKAGARQCGSRQLSGVKSVTAVNVGALHEYIYIYINTCTQTPTCRRQSLLFPSPSSALSIVGVLHFQCLFSHWMGVHVTFKRVPYWNSHTIIGIVKDLTASPLMHTAPTPCTRLLRAPVV
jgi:hypothetical protein